MVYETFNESQTFDIGKQLSSAASKGDVFCLIGDLGVGKTVFSKGFAEGLGIFEHITSPTFTIVQVYDAQIPLYHFDMYRIEDIDELEFIGFEEYVYGEGVCLIEWVIKLL